MANDRKSSRRQSVGKKTSIRRDCDLPLDGGYPEAHVGKKTSIRRDCDEKGGSLRFVHNVGKKTSIRRDCDFLFLYP